MFPIVSLLQKSWLFMDFSEETLKYAIVPLGNIQEYQRDQFLIVPQQKVDQIGLVLSGKVHILHLFKNGNHSLMNVVVSGGFTGTDLIYTRSQLAPYHAMATTHTYIFYLPFSIFTYPNKLDESLRLKLLERLAVVISQENMKKEYRLAILSQNGLRDRIMTYLSMQARKRGSKSFSIPFTREEMASFLCVNRSALSHELSLMQQEGLISFHKNSFTLHKLT